MYRRVLAFDYDGTLAVHGRVPLALCQAFDQLHLAGFALFLVTGRQFESVDLGSLATLFTGTVWENGAVLQHSVASNGAIHGVTLFALMNHRGAINCQPLPALVCHQQTKKGCQQW